MIFVNALATDSMLTISFFPNYFIIQDQHNRKMIGRGDRHEGPYVLHTSTVQADVMTTSLETNLVSTRINNISFHTWYNRLGHLSFK